MRYGVTVFLVFCVAVATARAQPGGTASPDRIAELSRELDELRALAAQLPTVEQSVQALTERLAVLEQELAKLGRQQASIPDGVERLDALAAKLRSVELELRAVTGRLADFEQPVSPEPRGVSTGGSALALRTDHGDYSIAFSGYAQVRWQLDTAGLSTVEDHTLRLRRARLGLSGHAGTPRLGYKILVSPIDTRAALDYYADLAVRKRSPESVVLRVGQYKTPFTRSFVTSSRALAFPERSLVVDASRYDRDVQVGVHGRLAGGRLGYHVSVGNGAGTNRVNDNVDVAVAARVELAAVGKRFSGYGDLARSDRPALMLGAGVVHDLVGMPGEIAAAGGGAISVDNDVDGDGRIDNARVVSASADATFRWRGVEIAGELVFRAEDFGTILEAPGNAELAAAVGTDGTVQYLSGYGQITYATAKGVLVGARVGGASVPFLGVGGRASAIPDGDRVLELDALVQYYRPYFGTPSRLVGLLYTVRSRSNTVGPELTDSTDHRVIAEFQLAF